MSSPVDICNQALAYIGDRRITRLDEEAQRNDGLVRYCAEFYEQARQIALEAHRWSFAKKAQALTRRTDVTIIGFKYAHQMPSDKLRVMNLVKGSQLTQSGVVAPTPASQYVEYRDEKIDRFKIVGNQIWSDCEHVALFYIYDSTNPNDWSASFRNCVARFMAHLLAGAIADDPNMTERHLRIYETNTLPNAQYYDSVQDASGENSDLETRLALSPSLRSRRQNQYGSDGERSFYDY